MKLIDTAEMRQVDTYRFEGPADNAWSLQDNALARLAVMLDLESRPDRVDEQPIPKPGAHGFYLVGNGYLQRNDKMENIDSAITVFKRALEIDPEYAPAHAGLAEAYWYKSERSGLPTYLSVALGHAERALEIDPKLPKALYTRGSVLYGQGRYTAAISDLREAHDSQPRDISMLLGLAKALDKFGEKTAAETLYKRGTTIAPHDWRVRKQLGAFYFKNGAYESAAQTFAQVVDLSPDNSQGYSNLGAALYFTGDIAGAKKAWERSIEIDPRDTAYSGLGSIMLNHTHDYKAATRYYRQAIELDPTDHRVWGNLAGAQYWNGEDATEAYSKAYELTEARITANSSRTDLYSYLAHYAAGQSRMALASEWLERSIGIDSNEPNEIVRNASTAERLGMRERAIELLSRAVERGVSSDSFERRPRFKSLVEDARYKTVLKREDGE